MCITLIGAGACAAPDTVEDTETATSPMVLAAWSQVIGNDPTTHLAEVIARFVVDEAGPDCSAFTLVPDGDPAGGKQPELRAQAAGTAGFPVKLCQLVMPQSWDHATLRFQNTAVTFEAGSGSAAGKPVEFAGPHRIGTRNGQIVLAGIGDSGCRGEGNPDGSRMNQDCTQEWFFGAIAEDLVPTGQEHLDLVVHVGDYRYRHENEFNLTHLTDPIPAQASKTTLGNTEIAPLAFAVGDQFELQLTDQENRQETYLFYVDGAQPAGQDHLVIEATPGGGDPVVFSDGAAQLSSILVEVRDTWKGWQLDFFAAAQPLLSAAPWVFVRGNHEQCGDSYFSIGWLYFFEANDSATASSCASAGELVAPWSFDVGLRSLSNTVTDKQHFVVVDTSPDRPSSSVQADLQKNFETALGEDSSSWWLTHKPYLGFTSYKPDSPPDEGTREELRDAWTAQSLCAAGQDCPPNTIVSGHQHYYQRVRVTSSGSTDWVVPQQYIIGNGGVDIDAVGSDHCPDTSASGYEKPVPRGSSASLETSNDFGWVVWTRTNATAASGSGWSEKVGFVNASGSTTASSCNLDPGT